jgi:hypothetical protein
MKSMSEDVTLVLRFGLEVNYINFTVAMDKVMQEPILTGVIPIDKFNEFMDSNQWDKLKIPLVALDKTALKRLLVSLIGE